MDGTQHTNRHPEQPDSSAAGREVFILPVSFAQQRLFFLSRLEPDSPYNLFGSFEIGGALDASLLKRAVDGVVARHEILRTTFAMMQGEPVQVVAPERLQPVPVIDLGLLGRGDRERVVERLTSHEAQRPFDLNRGPLLRLLLFRMGDEEHLLFYALHHIVADGWSEQILIREIADHYQAFAMGRSPRLEELEIQYGDFAHWQREWLEGEALEELLDYWRQRLDGATGKLELPTDRPRPDRVTHHGGQRVAYVDEAVTARLAELARTHEATLYQLLLSAFGALLSRHAGEDDVLIGSPVTNRDQVELEPVIGLFLNTIVLRLDLADDPPFETLVQRARDTLVEAQEHADLPFERLVNVLDLGRDQSRNPLFQVFLNLDVEEEAARTSGEVSVANLTLRPRDVHVQTAKFDLLLNVSAGRRLGLGLEYNTALFDATTAERLLRHQIQLLEGAVLDPGRRVSSLPLLTAAERWQMLGEWNATERAAYPEPVCVHDLVARAAAKTPDAPAARSGDRELSFRQLLGRAHALAHRLQDLGVGPESIVGVLSTGSPEALIGILAVLEAGGAYLPIDPAYPQRRIAFMVADAGVDVLLADPGLDERPPAETEHVLLLEEDGETADDGPPAAESPESLAYVIYTSGSTGTPKGVMVPHRGVVNYLGWCAEAYAPESGDGAPVHTSLGFDLTVTSLFAPLAAGRPVTFLPPGPAAEALAAELEGSPDFSFVKATPGHLGLLERGLDAGKAADAMRLLILGGEPLQGAALEFWRQNAPATRLINEYGPTETVVGCSVYEVPTGWSSTSEVPIGRPTGNSRIYTLDARGRPAPLGSIGELTVSGNQVSRGYLGRPARTAESFVPDPFSGKPGARLYRTGDLAHTLADGALRLAGRRDRQTKVLGNRVELGEIEASLLARPEVAAAVVLPRNFGGSRRLVAYLVAANGARLDGAELRNALRTELPEHMIPAELNEVSEIPLTAHGKVDREALEALGTEELDDAAEYVAPRDLVEETLAAIWATTLGRERVGVRDNFFTLGGDSILTIQVVALARAKGIELSLPEIFRHPTVSELAEHARVGEEARTSSVRSSPFELVSPEDRARLPEDLADAYPLSRMQLGMLYHIDERPDAPTFHSINSYHLRMPLDPPVFWEAVERITARHANLRTSFDLTTYSEPLQLVHREPCFPVPVVDLRRLSAERQEEEIEAYRRSELVRRFDLSTRPQLRFLIHWRSEETFQFTLTENHAIIDGWSLHTIYSEILGRYFAHLRGEVPPELQPLSTTFRDFIALERQALTSEESRRFWGEKLRGAAPLRLPVSRDSTPPPGPTRCERLDVSLAGQLTEGLGRVARDLALPLKSLLLAVHCKVMGTLAGETDVLTGLSSNGRPETDDGQRVCGLFLNTLPIRLDLSPGSWRELAERAHAAQLEILPHRRYPMAAIQEDRGPEPLLSTSFVYLNFHVMADAARSQNLEGVDSGAFIEETNFSVMTAFSHTLDGSALNFILTCDRTVLSSGRIRALRDYYLTALERMASDPESSHHAAPLLPASERHLVLEEWGRGRPLPSGSAVPIHQRFRIAVERTPDRICLVAERHALTFAAVGERVRHLAHQLRSLGVGPESVVALPIESSPQAVIALLGILEARGAYLPLDPDGPRARLRAILDIARPEIVVVRGSGPEPPGDPWDGIRTVDLDRVLGGLATSSAPVAGAEPEPAARNRLAYILFTSGSTGEPKGVEVEHRHLASYLEAGEERLELGGLTSFALVSPLTADLGLTVLLPPLALGRTLHVPSTKTVRDAEAAAAYMATHRVECIKIVPSHLAALLSATQPADVLPRRTLILGGESLAPDLVKRIRALAPDLRIYNHYGPTESTVGTIAGRVDESTGEEVPLGFPLTGAVTRVLDADGQPVPPGTPGELYLGGSGVARGYSSRTALTAERFLPEPFDASSGSRLYRTGDRVRFQEDGSLCFLGRTDDQIKIRGFRVEPEEIAAAISRQEGVHRAVVTVRGTGDERRLAAYVVPDTAGGEVDGVDEEVLRGQLSGELPDDMVPSTFVFLPELPLTRLGKVDRSALPEPPRERPREIAAPRDPLELQLVHLWEEVLSVRPVGLHDDFFELGGNSLLSIRLVAMVRQRMGVRVPLATLVESRTIARIAEILRREEEETPRHLSALQPNGSLPPFFCVHPGHGSISSYLGLARHLGPEQPFYGLQALDFDRKTADGDDSYRSVEELAATYLDEVLEIQPTGPYYLGGWSYGGLVAFDMAQQLLRRGEQVAALALFDVRSPAANRRLASLGPEIMKTFILLENAKIVAGIPANRLPLRPEDLVGLPVEEQLDRILKRMDLRSRLPAGIDAAMVRHYLEIRVDRFRSILEYQPRPYSGPVTLFRARDVYTDTALSEAARIFEEAARSPTYRWDEICTRDVEVVEVPGDHETLVYEPNVPTLALELAALLERSRSRHESDPGPGPQGGGSPGDEGETRPALPRQEEAWLLETIQPGAAVARVAARVDFEGPLDSSGLRGLAGRVLSGHAAFHDRFKLADGELLRRPAASLRIDVGLTDLEEAVAGGGERLLDDWTAALVRSDLDLASGPPVRAGLARISETRHRLVLVAHRTVADERSIEVVAGQIRSGLGEGGSTTPTDDRSELARAMCRLCELAEGEAARRRLVEWRRRLTGAEPLQVPGDGPVPAFGTLTGRRSRQALGQELSDAVRETSERVGTTPLIILLAGVWALARRVGNISGPAASWIYVPVDLREVLEPEAADLVGPFTDQLPVPLELPERGSDGRDASFSNLLEAAHEAAVESFESLGTPFARLREELVRDGAEAHIATGPDAAATLLRSNALSVDLVAGPRATGEGSGDGGTRVETRPLFLGGASAPLELVFEDGGDGIDLVATFATEVYDRTTVQRMGAHLRRLLEIVLGKPERPLTGVDLLSPAERHQILVEWAGSGDSATDRGIHELFAEAARRHPDAVALSFEARQVTYGALAKRVVRVAGAIAGATPGSITAWLIENPFETVTGLMASAAAGRPFLYLDPAHPPDRNGHVIEEAAPEVIVTDSAVLADSKVPLDFWSERLGASRLVLDRPLDAQPLPEDHTVPGETPLYVVYTSGSSGRPKGIVQSQRSFSQFVRWQSAAFGVGPGARVAEWASLTYDAAYCEIFGALCSGATLCLAPASVRFDPHTLARWLEAERVQWFQTVPSFARELLRHVDDRSRTNASDPLVALRTLLLAGEVLPPDLASAWLEALSPGASVTNLYGPTETVLGTWMPVDHQAAGRRSIPVGRAIEGRQILVLDPEGRPCPIGVEGEMTIHGPWLTQCYLGRPRETAEAYVPEGEGAVRGGRRYRTGDAGRWLPDGTLEFRGRMDSQIKLRGMRVELEEIEAVLRAAPEVADCAVTVHEPSPGDQRLAALVVPGRGAASGTGDLAPEARYLTGFETVYDEIYAMDEAYSETDSAINLRSWTSSYSRRSMPEAEILETVEATVERIRSFAPRRALEIGCGSGLILERVAPDCDAYWGLDLSAAGLEHLRQRLASDPESFSRVELVHRAAHDLSDFGAKNIDTVILSIVLQHFPNAAYLEEVLRGAADVVQPGGRIVLACVRSLALLETFHTSVQLARAGDRTSCRELRRRVAESLATEKDLLIAPGWFTAFAERHPRVFGVRVELRPGRLDNEITRFQYDVVLEIETPPPQPLGSGWWRTWETLEGGTEGLSRLLEQERPERLGLRRVSNGRLVRELAATELLRTGDGPERVSKLRSSVEHRSGGGIHPEDLRELAARAGYRMAAGWAKEGGPGCFDAVLILDTPTGEDPGWLLEPPAPLSPGEEGTNDPLLQRQREELVPRLERLARRQMPPHMVPASIELVSELPRTRTGKLDRKALPSPSVTREGARSSRPPRNRAEWLASRAWAKITGRQQPTVGEDLFAAGGRLIDGPRLLLELRRATGVELPLRELLVSPTLGATARAIERAGSVGLAPEAELSRRSRIDEPIPLSHAQCWSWELGVGRRATCRLQIEIRGPATGEDLQAAWRVLVERHEALRTAFVETATGSIEQRIRATGVDLELKGDGEADSGFVTIDLDGSLPVRASLNSTGDGRSELVLVAHPLVCDAWSLAMLGRELARLYGAHTGRCPTPPPTTLQPTELALRQRTAASRPSLSRPRPGGSERQPPHGVEAGRLHSAEIDLAPELVGRLRELAAREGMTPAVGLMGVCAALLARRKNLPAPVLGVEVDGRAGRAARTVVGRLAYPIPVAIELSDGPSFRDLMRRSRDALLRAHARRFAEPIPTRGEDGSSPVDGVFACRSVPRPTVRLDGVEFSAVRLEDPLLTGGFSLEIEELETAIQGRITSERPIDEFAGLLEQSVREPDVPLTMVSPGSPAIPG